MTSNIKNFILIFILMAGCQTTVPETTNIVRIKIVDTQSPAIESPKSHSKFNTVIGLENTCPANLGFLEREELTSNSKICYYLK